MDAAEMNVPRPRITKDGGAAFPQLELAAGERDGHGDAIEAYTVASGGMKLRDYFAAAALPVIHHNGGRYGDDGLKAVAEQAYRVADAMLKARQQNGGEHDR